jgi:hypothetical protein
MTESIWECRCMIGWVRFGWIVRTMGGGIATLICYNKL